MKSVYFLMVLSGISLIAGCNTTQNRVRHTQTTDSTINRTVTQHDEQIAKLTFQLNQLKESNRNCIEYINKINKQIALLNRKIILTEQANKKISIQLQNEKINRRNETDRILKEVAKETAAAVNARRTPPPQKTRAHRSGPAMQGEFYEYIVESGATLGAISRAYKVSVSDIKKANKLKSDNIRVGQKLYIPKK